MSRSEYDANNLMESSVAFDNIARHLSIEEFDELQQNDPAMTMLGTVILYLLAIVFFVTLTVL